MSLRWNLPTLSARANSNGGDRLIGWLRRAARGALCVAVLLLLWLSLVPGDMQHRTGMHKDIEHFLAYFLTGACLACAVERPWMLALLTGMLVCLAGALEVAQGLSPGRTANVMDFLASAAGAVSGQLIGALAFGWLSRRLNASAAMDAATSQGG